MRKYILYLLFILLTFGFPTLSFAHGDEEEVKPLFDSLSLVIIFFVISFLGLLVIHFYKKSQFKKEEVNKRMVQWIAGHILAISVVSFLLSMGYLNAFFVEKERKEQLQSLDYHIKLSVIHEERESWNHVPQNTEMEYESITPTTGDHYNYNLSYGYHKEYELGNVLHNLEYGDIVIYFHQEMTTEYEFKILKELSYRTKEGSGVLLLPNDKLENKIVVTAWAHKIELNSLDEKSISQFIYNFIHEGPESLPIVRTVHNKSD